MRGSARGASGNRRSYRNSPEAPKSTASSSRSRAKSRNEAPPHARSSRPGRRDGPSDKVPRYACPRPPRRREGLKWQSFAPPAARQSRRYRGLISHRRSHLAIRARQWNLSCAVEHQADGDAARRARQVLACQRTGIRGAQAHRARMKHEGLALGLPAGDFHPSVGRAMWGQASRLLRLARQAQHQDFCGARSRGRHVARSRPAKFNPARRTCGEAGSSSAPDSPLKAGNRGHRDGPAERHLHRRWRNAGGNPEFHQSVHETAVDSRPGEGCTDSTRANLGEQADAECVNRARSGLWGEGLGNDPSYPASRRSA